MVFNIFARSKKKINLEDFCRDFYEQYLLVQKLNGVDVSDVFPKHVKKTVEEVDDNFSKVSLEKLVKELIILRFELFALAWLHSFGEKSAVAQSIFTANFLEEYGAMNVWKGMGPYNQAIARSSKHGKSSDKRFLARVNLTRADLFDQHLSAAKRSGIDIEKNPKHGEAIARPLNRLFSEKPWKQGVTAGFLILVLCDRLGMGSEYVPSEDASFRLSSIIRGLYDGAEQSWDSVQITA